MILKIIDNYYYIYINFKKNIISIHYSYEARTSRHEPLQSLQVTAVCLMRMSHQVIMFCCDVHDGNQQLSSERVKRATKFAFHCKVAPEIHEMIFWNKRQ